MGRMEEDISGGWSGMNRNGDVHTWKDIHGVAVWLESRAQLNE